LFFQFTIIGLTFRIDFIFSLPKEKGLPYVHTSSDLRGIGLGTFTVGAGIATKFFFKTVEAYTGLGRAYLMGSSQTTQGLTY